ncbi:6-carboxytetrahydropterin synthase [Halomonas sp. GXIMD04776]|uniref:6-carboxytetrahydropterin synthase n=1 Tax=Halomonas sp. GXIMD04776 TaxID=3415605 RepID=UPI003C8B6B98
MTLFVNDLTKLDVSLWCSQRGLIGASWRVDAEFIGELGEDGVLFDSDHVASWIQSRLNASMNQTLLVPTRAPQLSVQECAEGLCVRTTLPYAMEIKAPRQAFTLLPWSGISLERLAAHYSEALSRLPPPRVLGIRLSLHEELIDEAAYTFSHGLKLHTGNDQRIAHGHRSRLHIWCNGERQPELEARWAQRLNDRYLVDTADILEDSAKSGGKQSSDRLTLGYRAEQGRFLLRLPRERCEILPVSTSIEHIAAWLADQIARDCGQTVRVQAFEGIGKGAIAEASA